MLDFPLWLRATHFLNLLFISLLVRSGLEILSAHPKLYWNDDCTPGSEWLRLTRKRLPEHALWTSRDEETSFSSWIALPGRNNLGLGRHWHFLTDAAWLFTGILYVVMLSATPEWRRLIPTSWSVLPGAAHVLRSYLSFHLVVTPGRYNPLEQLSYFSVVFLLSPLAIATGLAMSPSIAARFPWYIRLFRGRQAARSIHFLCLCAFFSFFIMHVSMVIAHGAISEMGLIVLGDIHHLHGMLGLILGLAGLTGIIVIHMVATRFSLSHPRVVQRSTQTLTDPLRRAFDRRRSALTVRSSRYGVTTDSSYRERDVTVAQPGADVMWPRDCEMVSAARESRGPSGRMGSRATRKRSHKPRSSLSATQHG